VARVTLQTIADQVGVSRMTVSNAFSRPDQLSEAMRQRILDAAKKLGYVGPDPAARALARGTTGAIGILLTSSLRYAFDDDVATGFLGSIAGELAPTGLALTLLSASGVGDTVPARDVPMDAAIVYSCDPSMTAVDWLTRRGLPIVFVDQEPLKGITSVTRGSA
jgi:DNA-binding LacI/PurR family transcriptional regulator